MNNLKYTFAQSHVGIENTIKNDIVDISIGGLRCLLIFRNQIAPDSKIV